MIEIRFHGRGGQGALTAARILAAAFWKENKYVLVLPEFKSERRSAPIAVFMRVDENPHESGEFSDDLLAEAPKRKGDYVKVKKVMWHKIFM